jgi:hypothetical protein
MIGAFVEKAVEEKLATVLLISAKDQCVSHTRSQHLPRPAPPARTRWALLRCAAHSALAVSAYLRSLSFGACGAWGIAVGAQMHATCSVALAHGADVLLGFIRISLSGRYCCRYHPTIATGAPPITISKTTGIVCVRFADTTPRLSSTSESRGTSLRRCMSWLGHSRVLTGTL